MIKKEGTKKEYENTLVFIFSIVLSLVFFVWILFFSDTLKDFLLWLENFIKTEKEYTYLVAFILAVTEGTIILGMLPGTSYIVTMGVFWARGDIDPLILFPLIIAGAFIGDIVGYSIGFFSSGFVKKKIGQDKNYKMTQSFIDKHGGKAVLFARFISGTKELVPFIAGVMNMKLKRFMPWNFFGAIGWSILWIFVGYFSGSVVEEVESVVKTVGGAFLIFFIIAMYFFYRKNKDLFL